MGLAFSVDHKLEALAQGKPRIGLPLVSVIVVNYNYGRFLREAVESAFRQTYPHLELIVIDDASLDESAGILDGIEAAYPDVKVIRRQENGGQSVAMQEGFRASSGDYVVFLDADDILFPNFVETHVFVHLSLRIPVGFSSSDMAQATGARLVLGTLHHFSDYVRSQKGRMADLIRPISDNAPELWPLAPPGDLAERIVYVAPAYQERWVWAATSGNCFRREALSLLLDNAALGDLRICTDSYLVRGAATLSGSVLIDRTLAVYRLHGSNWFTRNPNLNGFVNYDRGGDDDNDQNGRRLVIDYLIANAESFGHRLVSPSHLLAALRALNNSWPRLPSRVPGCRSYVGGEVIAHFPQMSEAVGLWRLVLWVSLLGVAPWTLGRACFHVVLRGRRRALRRSSNSDNSAKTRSRQADRVVMSRASRFEVESPESGKDGLES